MIRRRLAMLPVFLYKRKNRTKMCNHSFAHRLEANNKCLALYLRHPSHISSSFFLQLPPPGAQLVPPHYTCYLLWHSLYQLLSQILLFSSVISPVWADTVISTFSLWLVRTGFATKSASDQPCSWICLLQFYGFFLDRGLVWRREAGQSGASSSQGAGSSITVPHNSERARENRNIC